MHKLIIAGPGAGKTTRMVDSIINDLPNLTPYRYMVAITYTNAATDNILEKLSGRIDMPNNLFIGTIHSFLIKFILHPYGYLCGLTPQNKKYIDQVFGRMRNEQEKEVVRTKADELVQKGLITYDKILELSHKIVTNYPKIREVIGYRIQFLFVDEYQDARLYQHEIIKQLMRIDNKVELIGDPYQSIYGFQYETSQLRDEPTPINFQSTPILEIQTGDQITVEPSKNNFRSTDNIITILNSMNNGLQDLMGNHHEENHPIIFLAETNPIEILKQFDQMVTDLNLASEEGKYHKMILGRTWNLLGNFIDEFEIIAINNKQERLRSSFAEFKRVIIAILGTSLKKIEKDHKISRIQFRKFVLECLFEIRALDRLSGPMFDLIKWKQEAPLHRLIINKWNSQFPTAFKNYADTADVKIGAAIVGCLEYSLMNSEKNNGSFVYSTIHGAKGLEATCVLVIAEAKSWGDKITANEHLGYWLQSDKECDDDEPRCGYVAFSRARKLLVIASLEELSDANKLTLDNLSIRII